MTTPNSDTPRTDALIAQANAESGGPIDFELRLAALARQLEREAAAARRGALEDAAKIAERHYIPGHSVAGPHFAKAVADSIRALNREPLGGMSIIA